MNGCLHWVSRLKAGSQTLPHSQVGLGEEGRHTHSQEEGPGMFPSQCCFSFAHPSLRDVANFVRGKKHEEKLAGAGSRQHLASTIPDSILRLRASRQPGGKGWVVEQGAHPTPVKTVAILFKASSLLREKYAFHPSSQFPSCHRAISGMFATRTGVAKIVLFRITSLQL